MNNCIALIADTHFGIKKSNTDFFKSQAKFIKEEFVPYLHNNKIEYIFWLGDVHDNRNHLNIKIKNYVYDLFENYLKDFKIKIILGNHDIYYQSTTEVHSLKWLKKFDNIEVIENIKELTIYGKKLLFVPWQVDVKDFINNVKENEYTADICFGHFEIAGFKLNKFKIADNGEKSDFFFDRFKYTFSGHFHTRNKQNYNGSEIVYIGSPYQLTRSDSGEERGFCVLNLDTYEYQFVNNKSSLKFITLNYPEKIYKNIIEGNVVDINVKYDNTYDENTVDKYISMVEKFKPISTPNIKIINDFTLNNTPGNYNFKSPAELMKEYVFNIENIKNKNEILSILENLFNEARNEL